MSLLVSLELRKLIVAWRYELHMPISDIVHLSSHCKKTVHNILKSFREDDNEFNHSFTERRGCKRLLDRDDLNYLESILRAEPGLFLDELQDKLRTVRDIEVSIATISRTLSRLAITNKTIAKEAAERNEHLRATWEVSMAQYDPQQLVFIDEARVDDQTNVRKNGWAPLGQACVRRTSFLRGQKYSILPALSVDGIVALDIFEGSVNRESFLTFLQNHLVCLPYLYFPSPAYSVESGPAAESLPHGSQCGRYGQLLNTP
jgi:transposase